MRRKKTVLLLPKLWFSNDNDTLENHFLVEKKDLVAGREEWGELTSVSQSEEWWRSGQWRQRPAGVNTVSRSAVCLQSHGQTEVTRSENRPASIIYETDCSLRSSWTAVPVFTKYIRDVWEKSNCFRERCNLTLNTASISQEALGCRVLPSSARKALKLYNGSSDVVVLFCMLNYTLKWMILLSASKEYMKDKYLAQPYNLTVKQVRFLLYRRGCFSVFIIKRLHFYKTLIFLGVNCI